MKKLVMVDQILQAIFKELHQNLIQKLNKTMTSCHTFILMINKKVFKIPLIF
jgi:hypothetical protein